VFCRESEKIVSMYAVLPAGQLERCQVALFNPSQYRYFTHAAISGDSAGGKILGEVIIGIMFQRYLLPPGQCLAA